MIRHYLRIALRSLLKQKAYSVTTVFGLSIGIASCILILLFVVDELSYDQQHVNKDRIYRLVTDVQGSTNGGIAKVAGAWGLAAKDEIPEIEAVSRFVISGQLLFSNGKDRFYENAGFYADPSVFKIFSYPLSEGNSETALALPNTMVITRPLAERYFGGKEAIGQTLQIDGNTDYKITGVLEEIPSTSHFTFSYLLSMSSLQHPQKDTWLGWNQFYTYLQLQANANPDAVIAKFKPILEKNMDAQTSSRFTPFLQPLTSIHLYSHLFREINPNSNILYIYIFAAIAILILTISCANFINLSTAQASARAKEIGVRKVNGAVRKQLITQFLLETFLICMLALIIANILTIFALPTLNELTGKNIQTQNLNNPNLIGSVLLTTLTTALLAGSYPAFYQAALKPIQVLKGKWAPSGSSSLRKGLVVFQFTLSSILIIASIVILQQLHFIQNRPLGFDPQQIITIPIQSDYLRTNFETIKKELLSHSGISSVSLSGTLPGGNDWGIPVIPEGFENQQSPPIRVMAVDEDFLRTYGIEIIAGRNFKEELASDSAAYILNEEATRQLGWQDPLSKTISMPYMQHLSAPVIGVVKDFHFRSMHEAIAPLLFFKPPRGSYSIYSIKIDAKQTENVIKFIENKFKVFDPQHPLIYNFFDTSFGALHRQEIRIAHIVGYFTAIGIFLACLGLYSLASFTSEQRRKEIGIRKVVGASTKQIVLLLSKGYLALVITGFALAIPIAWWAIQQWLNSFAYHVNFNFGFIGICGLVTATVALTTVGYRAIKAAGTNPVDSLKNE